MKYPYTSPGWQVAALCACLLASPLLSPHAYGFAGGEGTHEDPYLVQTAEHLDAVRDYPAAHFVQIEDIDLGVAPWNEGSGWNPLCSTDDRGGTAPFTGVYDGNGFRIIFLTIDHDFDDGDGLDHWTTRPWGGLFDTIAVDGVVRNVILDGAEVRGGYMYSAPLAGDNQGLIENCHSRASSQVIEAYEMVGGLVGSNAGTIRDSSAAGMVQGGSSVGGLVGENFALIEYSSASGDVEAENHSVGGLAGENEGTIRQSEASGAVHFVNVEENDYFNGIGGLVGDNLGDGLIEGCHATGNVNGVANPEHPSSGTGGLVGNNIGDIQDSYATGSVAGQQRVGGLVGSNEGQIARSQSSGAVDGDDYVGGLAGRSFEGGIDQSYAVGSVSGITHVGGLAGKAQWSGLIDSFARGSVTGEERVGGLVGLAVETVINRCYSTGPVSAEDETKAGGLIGGVALGSPVSDSYWNTETSGWETSHGGEGRTTERMSYPFADATFANWDIGTTWAENAAVNSGYPYIEGVAFVFGFGTEEYPYIIESAAHLNSVRSHLGPQNADKRFVLIADIDLYEATREGGVYANPTDSQGVEYDSSTSYGQGDIVEFEGHNYISLRFGNQGKSLSNHDYWFPCDYHGWEPIGTIRPEAFCGHFDGNGHTISGLYINRPLESYIGLFGGMYAEGVVENLHVVDAEVTGNGGVGILVGASHGLIRNCHASGEVRATYTSWRNDAGGLVGQSSGYIADSSFTGMVAGYVHIGGLLGANYAMGDSEGLIDPATVESSFADAVVSGELTVGGLVGYNAHGAVVKTSYSKGSVNGEVTVGGLVGDNHSSGPISRIENSYSHASVSGEGQVGGLVGLNGSTGLDLEAEIINSYSTGSVTGDAAVGGLVGESQGVESIVNSYWNTETSGQGESAGGEARTTDQMTHPHAAETYVGWDFSEIWAADAGGDVNNGYPYLGEAGDALPPSISEGPSDLTVTAPASAVFTVSAAGEAPLSYQWEVSTDGGGNWTTLAGGQTANYDTGATSITMNGNLYRVVVSNALGSATSSPAVLTVTDPGPPTRGLFGEVEQVSADRYRSVVYGELEFADGGTSDTDAFGHSLGAPLQTLGGSIHSPLYGNLTPNPWGIDDWVVSQFFGLVHFGSDAAQYDGWVNSERFDWMKFEDGYLWVSYLQTWLAVNPNGSFHSFDFGWMVPQAGSWTRYNTRIGMVTADPANPQGWLVSDDFGFVWFARDGTATWFWSTNRNEWIGITPEGGLWSTAEGRFLE